MCLQCFNASVHLTGHSNTDIDSHLDDVIINHVYLFSHEVVVFSLAAMNKLTLSPKDVVNCFPKNKHFKSNLWKSHSKQFNKYTEIYQIILIEHQMISMIQKSRWLTKMEKKRHNIKYTNQYNYTEKNTKNILIHNLNVQQICKEIVLVLTKRFNIS